MIPAPTQVWLVVEPIDMRAGIDGLSQRIQNTLGRSPCDGSAYAFRNRRLNRLKLLLWETDLSAQRVVEIYAQRWGVESMFHNLKRWWGVTNLWQQSKDALELWMQIRCTAYALMQLLAPRLWESFPLLDIASWREGAMITAGLFAQWMRIQFIGLRVRDAYDPKSGQFVMPFPGQDQRLQC
jgi:hypothetical protein